MCEYCCLVDAFFNGEPLNYRFCFSIIEEMNQWRNFEEMYNQYIFDYLKEIQDYESTDDFSIHSDEYECADISDSWFSD